MGRRWHRGGGWSEPVRAAVAMMARGEDVVTCTGTCMFAMAAWAARVSQALRGTTRLAAWSAGPGTRPARASRGGRASAGDGRAGPIEPGARRSGVVRSSGRRPRSRPAVPSSAPGCRRSRSGPARPRWPQELIVKVAARHAERAAEAMVFLYLHGHARVPGALGILPRRTRHGTLRATV
jgi:hypothetical protein